MRYIVVPEDVALVLPGASGPCGIVQSFAAYVAHLLDTDQRFNASGKGIRAAVRIEDAVRRGGLVELEEDDWATLRAANEAPTAGYPALIRQDDSGKAIGTIPMGRQLLPFVNAIEEARSERPTSVVFGNAVRNMAEASAS